MQSINGSGVMSASMKRVFYLNPGDWTWWVWMVTAIFITIGICGVTEGYLVATVVTVGQSVIILAKEKGFIAFPVQLRLAYLLLLLVSFLPGMRWLYWLPMLGTFALVIFGYCLLARELSLLPWNRAEAHSWERMRRTFFSRPDPGRLKSSSSSVAGCAGGLCSIEAQVPSKTGV